jgi:hypothetical protein
MIEQIRELEAKGVLGPEECPTSEFWQWRVLEPEKLPVKFKEQYEMYGEIRWWW